MTAFCGTGGRVFDMLGVEGCCYAWSLAVGYTHTVELSWTSVWPVTEVYVHTTNKPTRQISLLPAGFEPAIPAIERPQINVYMCDDEGHTAFFFQMQEQYRQSS